MDVDETKGGFRPESFQQIRLIYKAFGERAHGDNVEAKTSCGTKKGLSPNQGALIKND